MFALVKLVLVVAVAFLQMETAVGQRWVPATTTAAEMWNGYTWYWPYMIAASDAYRQYFVNAQQITNQLYQQAYITGAFTGGSNTPNTPNVPNVPNVPNIPQSG